MKKVSQKDYKETIKYLSQIEYIDCMINEKQSIIDSLRASLTGKGVSTEGDRVQSSPVDAISDTCAKIVDLEREINMDIDRLVDMKAQIMKVIDRSIGDLRCRTLIYMRYVKYQPISACAHQLKVSESAAYGIHRDGIRQISRLRHGQNNNCEQSVKKSRNCKK